MAYTRHGPAGTSFVISYTLQQATFVLARYRAAKPKLLLSPVAPAFGSRWVA